MNYSEFKNLDELRSDYPDLPEEVYAYRRDGMVVWSIRLFLQFLIPFLLLTTGIAQKLSKKLTYGKGLFLSGVYYGLAIFIIIFLINLPLNFYSSFYLRHKYGLSNQNIWRWLELNLKSFALNDLVITIFLWLPYLLIYKSPKTWWILLGIAFIPIIIFMVYISPMVIDPIYNKYTSIEDERLGQEISSLLRKADIEDADIFMVDKSKDTKTMNAYMTGIGKSKRIVLWDTTIENLDEDEVLSITAHEIGHYVKGHIIKSIGFSILGTFVLFYLVYKTSSWIMDNSGRSFGFSNIYNYASLPLLILVLNLYLFLGNPITNLVSRLMETEADAYEISLTEDRRSAISAMEKLYVQSLGLPRPSKLYKIWYHSHPTLEERVFFYRTHPIDLDYKLLKIPFLDKK